MIDQDKIRALSMCIRADADFSNEGENWAFDLRREAADAIDLLLAEVEAAAADKRDAERYRFIKSKTKTFSLDMSGQHTYVVDFAIARLRGPSLDQAVDAALAQRQGEGS